MDRAPELVDTIDCQRVTHNACTVCVQPRQIVPLVGASENLHRENHRESHFARDALVQSSFSAPMKFSQFFLFTYEVVIILCCE